VRKKRSGKKLTETGRKTRDSIGFLRKKEKVGSFYQRGKGAKNEEENKQSKGRQGKTKQIEGPAGPD